MALRCGARCTIQISSLRRDFWVSCMAVLGMCVEGMGRGLEVWLEVERFWDLKTELLRYCTRVVFNTDNACNWLQLRIMFGEAERHSD